MSRHEWYDASKTGRPGDYRLWRCSRCEAEVLSSHTPLPGHEVMRRLDRNGNLVRGLTCDEAIADRILSS